MCSQVLLPRGNGPEAALAHTLLVGPPRLRLEGCWVGLCRRTQAGV